MTAISTNTPVKGQLNAARPTFFRRIVAFTAQYRTFLETHRELSGLSDRNLADLGLARGELVAKSWVAGEAARDAILKR
ncbi:DUF1127 domain-containing protein [Paracoccus litorisediminis]|uniref:DUF1127 domain-containing protein n=1 Tax=Paracoccus litorisediminis TaxID=2006130 RepID=UPI0037319302